MKIFLLLAAIGFSLNGFAQQKEGTIVYDRTIQTPVRMLEGANPEIVKRIPKSRTDQFELLFANGQSLWQFLPNAVEDDGHTIEGGGVVVRFARGSNDISFFDLGNGTRVDQREVFDRIFLVSDSIEKRDWKLSEETRTILDHNCRKATSSTITTRYHITMENGEMKRTPVSDTSEVIAWFTTDIPVSIGPAEYQGQLPGAILELDIANGRMVYKATEISPKVNANKIRAPKEGKKLTASEFAAEREKLMQEMQQNMQNGGGNFRIRM